jgi:FAD/FMN-containing dehydrogenase
MHGVLLAFGWFPEVKGIVVVLLAVGTMIGGSYLVLATDLGHRLGLLVVLAGLFGWMASMGIGLKGREPTWKGKEVIVADLAQSSYSVVGGNELLKATVDEPVDGWIKLRDADPRRGQTIASADEVVQTGGEFASGDYQAIEVFDKGGERWPNASFHLGKFKFNMDYVAFFHKPHYAVVELRPLVKQATEPGKAPPTPIVDTAAPARYVLMIRDMGSRRQPSVFITFGSSIIFALLCYMLHARDRAVAANRAGALVPAASGS